MNWTDFTRTVAERSGTSLASSRAVLKAAVEVATEQLCAGESVTFWGLGTLSSRWQAPRTLRDIQTRRKIRLDGRYTASFRPASALRQALLERTPQHWRSDEHQLAYRISEALIGDLAAYHAADAPKALPDTLSPAEIRARCAASFGETWTHITDTYASRVPASVTDHRDYLAEAAQRRWGQPTD